MVRPATDPKLRTTLSIALILGAWASSAAADVPLPPAPEHYFNDYADFVAGDVARRLDDTLRQFDEQTTSQVVVAIFPKLPAPSLEDFTARTAQAWRVGRKDLDNGAVLFVFAQDRKLRLDVGYGLEDKIPDAVAKRIIEDVIVPRFRSGDAAGGLTAGVEAILAAARGQASPLAETPRGQSPTGRRDPSRESFLFVVVGVAITILMIAASMLNRARSATFSKRGRQQAPQISGGGCLSLLGVLGGLGGYLWFSELSEDAKALIFILAVFGGVFLFILWAGFSGGWSGGSGWGAGGSAGGWSSGGWGSSSGGSGGGFSGGGGSFGGGGASGSW